MLKVFQANRNMVSIINQALTIQHHE